MHVFMNLYTGFTVIGSTVTDRLHLSANRTVLGLLHMPIFTVTLTSKRADLVQFDAMAGEPRNKAFLPLHPTVTFEVNYRAVFHSLT